MKILVTGAWKYTSEQLNIIRSMGHEVIEMPDERATVPCDDFEGIVCNGFFLHHRIEECSYLRYIQLTSAGLDRVPLEYIQARNIEIHNAGGVYSVPMAEYTVLKVLELYKDSWGFFQKQAEHRWEKCRDLKELYGKTVCIVGCGSVGTECAKRFHAFGCKVIGVDCVVSDFFDGIVSLEAGLRAADVVVLTLPLTAQTKGMINAEKVDMLRPGAIVINISRGAIIAEEALCRRDDVFYVLDVFKDEPLHENNSLWERKNICITPHNSFVGEGNSDRLAERIIENLRKAL